VSRIRSLVLALALIGPACADALEGVGDLSRSVVHGDESTTTTTTQPVEGPDLRLSPITDVAWSNDGIEATTASLDVDTLLQAVWLRGDGISPFVQSSRHEIARALPGIEFPQLAPEVISHISSQLVFDPATGVLDVSTAAAFGFWSAEPYTAPRVEAQLAVLRVGLLTFEEEETEGEIFTFAVSDGRELAWNDGDYVYQLFCRTGVAEEACFAMAEATRPLSILVTS